MNELREVTLGTIKYVYKRDNEKERLIDCSNNLVKVNLIFNRNPTKNKRAKDGLKAFFSELYS